MANQGLYNGFWLQDLSDIFIENPFEDHRSFSSGMVEVAGIVGAWTVSKRIFSVQAVP